LVHALFEQQRNLATVLRYLTTEAVLTPEVRKAAVRLAEEHRSDGSMSYREILPPPRVVDR
jgi:hypothetical protein